MINLHICIYYVKYGGPGQSRTDYACLFRAALYR